MAALQKKDHHIPKYIIALTYFVERSMTRLEAISLFGDMSLNTTVSELIRFHGLSFIKKRESHLNQAGTDTRLVRYWLADESKDHAYHLIQRHLPNFPR